MKLLVIGAQNIDVFAALPANYLLGDSNVSTINYAFGGVGRNIAVNLKSLGNEVHFLTVFGDDFMSQAAQNRLSELHIEHKHSKIVPNTPNSSYLAVLDEDNDLHLGLNAMDIVAKIDVPFLEEKQSYIEQFPYLIIDNNLTRDAIKYLVRTFAHKTIFMDAVSAKKVEKLKTLLPYIDYLKLNQLECITLTGKSNIDAALISPLLNIINTLVITNKALDIIVKTKQNEVHFTPMQITHIVNASGAGDAFFSGFIHGVVHQYSLDKTMHYAMKMAKLTLAHNESTNESLVLHNVEEDNE